jgi:anti-sigma B factor antagonist
MSFMVRSAAIGDTAHVVELSGEVDLYTSPEVKKELLRLIAAGARTVVIDLTETTFIDSAGLGVLSDGVKRLQPVGGRMALVCSDRSIRKVLEITRLDRVFTIAQTRADALGRLEARAASGRAAAI